MGIFKVEPGTSFKGSTPGLAKIMDNSQVLYFSAILSRLSFLFIV